MRRTRRFPHERASVTDARGFAVEALSGTPPEVLETIELMVSELATNCVRHAGSAFDVTVSRTPGEIRVEVSDRSDSEPVPRSPSVEDPTGRGLQIVAMLSGAWGVQPTEGAGKTVWFTVSDHQAADQLTSGQRVAAQRSPSQAKTLGSETNLIAGLRVLTPALTRRCAVARLPRGRRLHSSRTRWRPRFRDANWRARVRVRPG